MFELTNDLFDQEVFTATKGLCAPDSKWLKQNERSVRVVDGVPLDDIHWKLHLLYQENNPGVERLMMVCRESPDTVKLVYAKYRDTLKEYMEHVTKPEEMVKVLGQCLRSIYCTLNRSNYRLIHGGITPETIYVQMTGQGLAFRLGGFENVQVVKGAPLRKDMDAVLEGVTPKRRSLPFLDPDMQALRLCILELHPDTRSVHDDLLPLVDKIWLQQYAELDKMIPDVLFAANDYIQPAPETDQLGKGGFGTVRVLRGNNPDMHLCVKIREFEKGTSVRISPTGEFLMHLKVGDHPHIVPALAAVPHPLGMAVVLPVMRSLHAVLDVTDAENFVHLRRGAIDPVEFTKQLMSAVRHCHERGIMHNDIKPGNILWNIRYNQRAEIYLCDFGSSQCLGARRELLPTYTHMPPELFLEGESLAPDLNTSMPATESMDAWMVGVVALELAMLFPLTTRININGQLLDDVPPQHPLAKYAEVKVAIPRSTAESLDWKKLTMQERLDEVVGSFAKFKYHDWEANAKTYGKKLADYSFALRKNLAGKAADTFLLYQAIGALLRIDPDERATLQEAEAILYDPMMKRMKV